MRRATQFVYLVGAYQVWSQLSPLCHTWFNISGDETPLKRRLNDRYGGEGEWAIITGASEGIGRSYALELARAGYNLTLCARSVDKLEDVARQAQAANPSIKTKVVRLDVSSAQGDEYSNLFSQDERTTIVVNNAGIMKNKHLLKTEPAHLEALIKTNVAPYVLLTKYAMRHFLAQSETHLHKNALTYTSSILAGCKFPNTAVYSSTKTFIAVFAKMVQWQGFKNPKLNDLLDVQSLHPSLVSTHMTNHKKASADVVTAEDCVMGSLCDLGTNVMNVSGAMKHTIIAKAIPLYGWSAQVNKQIGKDLGNDKDVVIQD